MGNNGIALVMYATGREATKAQKALNNCLLGNTTIQANITSEGEAKNIMQQLSGGNSNTSQQSASRGNTPSNSKSSNDMWGNSMVPTSIFTGGSNSVWGAPSSSSGGDDGQRNTPQLQTLLLYVPVPIAALHQAGALVTLSTALWYSHELKFLKILKHLPK